MEIVIICTSSNQDKFLSGLSDQGHFLSRSPGSYFILNGLIWRTFFFIICINIQPMISYAIFCRFNN